MQMLNPDAKPFHFHTHSFFPFHHGTVLSPLAPSLLPPSLIRFYNGRLLSLLPPPTIRFCHAPLSPFHVGPFFPFQNRPYHKPLPYNSPPLDRGTGKFCFGSTRTGTRTRSSKASRSGYFGQASGRNLRKMWVPKNRESVQAQELPSNPFDFNEFDGKTTVMIKNIPNRFSRENLMDVIDHHCAEVNKEDTTSVSEYDFLYLPFDFNTGANYGFAFVNFTTTLAAMKFHKSYDGYMWSKECPTRKICELRHAKIQGRDALVKHFNHSYFVCNKEDYLPVVFSTPRNGTTCTTSSPTLLGKRIEPKECCLVSSMSQ